MHINSGLSGFQSVNRVLNTFAAISLGLFLLIPTITKAKEIILLIKNGHVIDPKNNFDSQMDIAIVAGKIFKVAANIPSNTVKKTVDVSGMYVTPGIIDIHVHVFHGTDPAAYLANGLEALPPDGFTFRAGVTTVVDAGSSGWRNFRQFKELNHRQVPDKGIGFS